MSSLHLGDKSGKEYFTYVNTIRSLLVGHTSLVDKILANPVIFTGLEKYVQTLVKAKIVKMPDLNKDYYRGILLHPSVDSTLEPLHYIKTISFTDDLTVAHEFASTTSPMSSYVMSVNPDFKGYIIKHKPEPKEVLFHYSWFDDLGLNNFEELDREVVMEQKELILFQNNRLFNLERV